jgi:hypothetical protein
MIGAAVNVAVQYDAATDGVRVVAQGAATAHEIPDHAAQHQAVITTRQAQMSEEIHTPRLP